MKINEFIEKLKTEQEVYPVKHYIPLQSKRIMARDALEKTMDESDGFINLDRTMADVYFYTSLIHEYFDVEIEDVENDYDALMSIGFSLDGAILQDVGKAYEVFEFEEKDLMDRNSIESQVAKVANSLVEAINRLSNKIENSIGDLDMSKIVPEGTDLNELVKMAKLLK